MLNPQEQRLSEHRLPDIENLKTDELLLNMGPQHPSTHGVLRVVVTTDGEIVKKAIPEIGYLHRCFEKHSEKSDWGGVAPYVDRLDYLASMNNSMGWAIAVEKMLELEVPRRAESVCAQFPRPAGKASALSQPSRGIRLRGQRQI